MSWEQAYRWEQDTFVMTLYPELRRRRAEVVHVSDHLLAWRLFRLRQYLGGRFRLLFSNGGGFPVREFQRFDFTHVLTPTQYEDALSRLPEERVFLVPYGIHTQRYARPLDLRRDEIRQRVGIPSDAFVILSVAALNMHHKRMHWVIDEVARTKDTFLVMAGAGEPEAAQVTALASERLAGRHLVLRDLQPDAVRDLYWAADVFTLGTVREAFGLVVLEAAAAGLPVVIHDDDHFRWMLEEPDSLVDMTAAGALGERLAGLATDEARRHRIADANLARAAAFDWTALSGDYRAMYEAIVNG
jgi:glycosyltransferase involved in cell wall biosynthesis